MIHIYSDETGKEVAQIPLTKLADLEKEIKNFVDYKLSTYKTVSTTKRSDLVPKSTYTFDISNEIAFYHFSDLHNRKFISIRTNDLQHCLMPTITNHRLQFPPCELF